MRRWQWASSFPRSRIGGSQRREATHTEYRAATHLLHNRRSTNDFTLAPPDMLSVTEIHVLLLNVTLAIKS